MKLFTLLSISLALCLSACKQQQAVKNADPDIPGFLLLKNKFKYTALDTFNAGPLSWESVSGHYQLLDSSEHALVWTGFSLDFQPEPGDKCYFYSWQQRDTGLIEFTILQLAEASSCINIMYLIYDKNGKPLDAFTASSRCADAEWGFVSKGRFSDGNTYQIVMAETEQDLEGSAGEGDSTWMQYSIEHNGKISEKELYVKHFIMAAD